MGVFESIGDRGHESVVYGHDPVSGLETIIAIHNTALGPALGGTRFFPYPNEQAALDDVLRLSRAMTYKSAAAGLDLGGGKAVIIGDPKQMKTERLFRAYARVVESLAGRYITAEDVGTSAEDMVMIARDTRFVTGLPAEYGGSDDPSPATARGVIAAMRATANEVWGSEDLSGKTVAIQGVGKVGTALAGLLTQAGAKTVVTDVDAGALEQARSQFGSDVVGLDEIYDVDCDIFAPCALGGSLNEKTIPRLRCAAVVGSANNQLDTEEDADRLQRRGILYAPDFVANAGGVINIAEELQGYLWERAVRAIDRIQDNTAAVYATAKAEGINTHRAAELFAERRIAGIGGMATWLKPPKNYI